MRATVFPVRRFVMARIERKFLPVADRAKPIGRESQRDQVGAGRQRPAALFFRVQMNVSALWSRTELVIHVEKRRCAQRAEHKLYPLESYSRDKLPKP